MEREIERSIQAGYVYFGAGGALGFDTLAAQMVLKLKERYPDIKLSFSADRVRCIRVSKGRGTEYRSCRDW